MIFNEIKCHFNTCLGLVGEGASPLCPRLVCYERVCYERVCYERGLLIT